MRRFARGCMGSAQYECRAGQATSCALGKNGGAAADRLALADPGLRRPARTVSARSEIRAADRRAHRHPLSLFQPARKDAARQPRQDHDLLPDAGSAGAEADRARYPSEYQRSGLAVVAQRYGLANVFAGRPESYRARFALWPDG